MRKKTISLFCLAAMCMQVFVLSFQSKSLSKNHSNNQIIVAVSDELRIDRPNETISLDWKQLISRIPSLKADYFVVKDVNTGKPIVSQTIDNDSDGNVDALIFQTNIERREKAKLFIIEQTQEKMLPAESKTYGRYVPERFDDFAWENDRIAFRMYGKGLESQLVSSGIDVWTKRVRESIINLWYKEGDAYYHKDNGTGIDMYSVKKSRGCGGSGIWDGKTLHTSQNYKDWKVIANGPIRTVFELTYEPWDVNGVSVSEVKRISLDAGQNLNRIESTYKVNGKIADFKVGVGIARHESDWKGEFDSNRLKGWMSRWENSKADGGLGCGVISSPTKIASMFDEQGIEDNANNFPHHYFILNVDSSISATYYTGGGWDKSGDFADKKAWNNYLESFSTRLNSPLKISFLDRLPKEKTGKNTLSTKVADSVIANYPKPTDLNYRGWHYDSGFLLLGIFEAWKKNKNPKHLAYVKNWVDTYLKPDGSLKENIFPVEEHQLDSILPGRLLIALYQETNEEKYKKAAFELTEFLKVQPRCKNGGYWHKSVYPYQMWLDGIYMAGPYSVEFGKAFNQPMWIDDAVEQAILLHKLTHESKSGLLFHGWEENKTIVWADKEKGTSPEFWGRAIGWYAVALVDSLDDLPQNHPKRAELILILQNLMESLAKYQDAKTGLWFQIVDKGDRADNWIETSASSMFIYAMAKGSKKGYLDKKYLSLAEKAYQNLVMNYVFIGADKSIYFTDTVNVGTLNPKVSDGSYESYIYTPKQVNDIKGLGAFVFASIEMEK